MLKYFYSLVILAHLVYAQDDIDDGESRQDYGWTTVKIWASTLGYNKTLNAYCTDDCIKECTKVCPTAYECTSEELNCGKIPLPDNVWPDCKRDDKCVPKGCECQVDGCPLWCEKTCDDDQKHCPGGVDDNGCKEMAVCINRPIGNNDQRCDGYCPKDCDSVTQNTCKVDPVDGCDQAPNCEDKSKDKNGEYCNEQQCTLTCETTHKFCKGEQMVDGCWEKDICVPKDTADSGALCDGNCPITCNPITEVKCDGTPIYSGPKAGCKNDDTCTDKGRDVNGEYCKDSSASHECPIVCKEKEHACPPRTGVDNCKEQATCTPCTEVDGECCPAASDCPALCKPHEKECTPPGTDNGCKKPPVCVVQERDFYGQLCQVHCPGVCNDNQIMCPGDRDDTGCPLPPTCHPIAKKQWGDDKGAPCPGYCPAYCQEWEMTCSSVQDPCDGCPTEAVCKPRAKNVNQIYCPDESASHGCDISCKTLDGESTICPANSDDSSPGCKESKVCMPRIKGKDGKLCPEHSVCNKKCANDQVKCEQGMDDNDCRNEADCVTVPKDQNDMPCLDFQCSPKCNEEIQKYCQGATKMNENNQLCPLVDYCVDRPLDKNNHRCPGHCQPECNDGYEVVQETGEDARGCPFGPVCNKIEVA